MYAGETEALKRGIIASFLENVDGLNVEVITSDETDAPNVPHTTIFFGGFYPATIAAFGISEGVDPYNSNSGDQAVIFTEVFQPQVFSFAPSVDQLGVAIGNITAHEAGHLLGMYHVDDETALMDAESPADTFLADQRFKRAPLLGREFFPIGSHDASRLLPEIVGGQLRRFSPTGGRSRGVADGDAADGIVVDGAVASSVRSVPFPKRRVIKCYCSRCREKERKEAVLMMERAIFPLGRILSGYGYSAELPGTFEYE